jgi:hypothetical protein
MASEKLFSNIPPFPDDVPTASMHRISLTDLRSGDGATAKALLTACQGLGFFLLDLNGDSVGEQIIDEVDQLLGLDKDVLNLPDEVKEQYMHDIPKSFLG